MSQKVLSDLDLGSVARIINLLDGTDPQHPATVAQLNAAIEGLAWKDSVRVATQSNINLSSPGSTIDGVTMVAGDRALVPAQSSSAQNGLYIWNGAAVAMTRALDASTAAELEQAVVTVEEGTSAGAAFRQTAVNFVLGTDPVTWIAFGTVAPAATETTAGIAELATQAETDTGTDDARIVTPLKLSTWSGRKLKGTALIGDGSATQFDVTHNFNTRDVQVEVVRNASPWDTVHCDITRPDANTVRLNFSAAPTSNQYKVTVLA